MGSKAKTDSINRVLAVASLVLFLLGPKANADRQIPREECTTIRLDQEDHSMAHVPVTNQVVDGVDTGTCYAHLASIMVDAYRFSHGDTNYELLTNPNYAAKLFKEEYNPAWKKWKKDRGASDLNAWEEGEGIPSLAGGGLCATVSKLQGLYHKDDSTGEAQISCDGDGDGRVSVSEWVKRMRDIKLGCYGRRFKTKKRNMAIRNGVQGRVLNTIQSHLSDTANGPIQPLGVSFCNQVLDNSVFNPVALKDKYRGKRCNKHFVAVIGRQWDEKNQRCQFIIRDSYGANNCQASTNSKADHRWYCESNGNVWVDSGEFAESVVSTFSLK